jgi:hypothetical protein
MYTSTDTCPSNAAWQAAFEAEIASLDRELSMLRNAHETEGEGLNEELAAANVSTKRLLRFVVCIPVVCVLVTWAQLMIRIVMIYRTGDLTLNAMVFIPLYPSDDMIKLLSRVAYAMHAQR